VLVTHCGFDVDRAIGADVCNGKLASMAAINKATGPKCQLALTEVRSDSGEKIKILPDYILAGNAVHRTPARCALIF
jgi:tRNA1(Val) A37 N6-methylase TrmN6